MKDNKQNLEQRLADILSKYVDCLNEDNATPIEELLNQYEPLTQDIRLILEVTTFIKNEIQSEVIPEEKREEAFGELHAKLLSQGKRKQLRDDIECGTIALPLDRRPDFLILLLHSMREIWGITRVVKLLFLMGKEVHLDTYVSDYYAHYAHNYGPFEEAIYKDIDVLKQYGLIKERKPRKKRYDPDEDIDEGLYPEKVCAIYQLTDHGKKFAQALVKSAQKKDPSIIQKIETIKSKYGHLPLKKLLKYIYIQYPDYAKNSKIRKEILEINDE